MRRQIPGEGLHGSTWLVLKAATSSKGEELGPIARKEHRVPPADASQSAISVSSRVLVLNVRTSDVGLRDEGLLVRNIDFETGRTGERALDDVSRDTYDGEPGSDRGFELLSGPEVRAALPEPDVASDRIRLRKNRSANLRLITAAGTVSGPSCASNARPRSSGTRLRRRDSHRRATRC